MQEKIKVSIPESVSALLYKDAEEFHILKPDGGANLNALVNRIIVNFHKEFTADEEALEKRIAECLVGVCVPHKEELLCRLRAAVADKGRLPSAKEKSVALSFKPTKHSEGAVFHIESALLKHESMSSFYRRLLTAYAGRSKTERERIVCREVLELLESSRTLGAAVSLSLENGFLYTGASVYAVAAAKDELFNYALFYSGGKNRTVRLAKIKNVSLLPEKSEIPEESAALFARQVAAAAQYPMYPSDDQPIKVKLTEKGKELFGRIYLYRPTPTAIEGDVYTFECSANQLLYYFERFGAEALILSPQKLGIFMRNYYYFALKKYRSLYGKE
ncbi:MAG: hypothetical protein IKC73_03400 [Clostridia bacterium]|nr:hypothetical protein [Clostridia bacterium]